jgi:cyanamide hydratase
MHVADRSLVDNVGLNPHLIDHTTITDVVSLYPRKQWSSCFAAAMREEMESKPWCHTTANDGFVEAVLDNKLMEPFDQ